MFGAETTNMSHLSINSHYTLARQPFTTSMQEHKVGVSVYRGLEYHTYLMADVQQQYSIIIFQVCFSGGQSLWSPLSAMQCCSRFQFLIACGMQNGLGTRLELTFSLFSFPDCRQIPQWFGNKNICFLACILAIFVTLFCYPD